MTAQVIRGLKIIALFPVLLLLACPRLGQAQKSGSFYLGDADGNGLIEIPDLSTLVNVLGNPGQPDPAVYAGHPQSRFRQELDGNGLIEVPDYSILLGWVTGNYSNRPGNPDQLALDGDTHLNLNLGDSVTLSAYALSPASQGAALRTGLGVIFKIDPSGTCTSAQIYGYNVAGGATINIWRDNAAYHYTLKPDVPDNGRATVRVNTNGCSGGQVIKIEVYIPNDGEAGVVPGRFPARLSASQLITATVPGSPPPDTSITSYPPNPSRSTSASFSFTCSESGCTFECELDSGGWMPCTSPAAYYGLSLSSHTFLVRALNGLGDPDPTPAEYTWLVLSDFYDDFEEGSPGWTATGLWHLVEDGVSPYSNSHSPTRSYWYGQDSTGDYDTGIANYGDLITPEFLVSDSAVLKFWSWEETESSAGLDTRVVYISTNGGLDWDLIWESDNSITLGWYQVIVSLGPYSGMNAILSFSFDTVDDWYNYYQGWYVDDIEVLVPQWMQVSAGTDHSCGLSLDSTLYCWGYNGSGQLGDGTQTDRDLPVQENSASAWLLVSAGHNHSCAIKSDSSLFCWGANFLGQLGDGTIIDKSTPTRESTSSIWLSVSSGSYHSCGIMSDLSLWCWGWNSFGQLGDGTTIDKNVPTQEFTAGNWLSVSSGGDHSCGIMDDGHLFCWGDNFFGQLGDGSTIGRNYPVQESSNSLWLAVSAGYYHTCGIRSDGVSLCWGYNYYGQLGNGAGLNQYNPFPVSGAPAFEQIDSGDWHTCAVTSGDALFCWGYNEYGQLGDGTLAVRYTPVQEITYSPWQSASSGGAHSCGIRSDNALFCWGDNMFGELGDGSTEPKFTAFGCFDVDLDEYYGHSGCGSAKDCNDGNPSVYPGAPELVDGVDNQCPGDFGYGFVDEIFFGAESFESGLPPGWSTYGYALWFITSSTASDGINSVQSGDIDDLEESTLRVFSINYTFDEICFDRRLSSELDYDLLNFYIDGALTGSWSGELPWRAVCYPVVPGIHELEWVYSKDGTLSSGLDAGLVDHIVYYTGACNDPDLDGYYHRAGCGTAVDCDGNNSAVYPGAPELMDGVDNQCPGDFGYGFVDEVYFASESFEGAIPGWYTGGDGYWFITSSYAYDGTYSVQSGLITDSQTSSLWVNAINYSFDEMCFARMVSSELDYDYLEFYVDNVLTDYWSGEVSWGIACYAVSAGIHEFKWTYSKDVSDYSGLDAGLIDDIVFYTGACNDPDGDSYYGVAGCGTPVDCNNNNPAVYPGASELVDGIDNQCPGDLGYGFVDEIYFTSESFESSTPGWFSGGDDSWYYSVAEYYDGARSVQSGDINDYQTSSLWVSAINYSFDEICFYRMVSSESGWDLLNFYIDDVPTGAWSGEEAWAVVCYAITPGIHEYKWTYAKDGSLSSGSDSAWVDYVYFVDNP